MGPEPRIFHDSLDWRFLLPLTDMKRIGLLMADESDLSRALEQVGIQKSQRFSLADLGQPQDNDVQSFVMPFGLPAGWVPAKHEAQVEFYVSVRRSISSSGCLLVGFNNVWNLQANSQKKYHSSTPRRITAQLKQAGFLSIKVFGAMPDLSIPEYIFDLDSRTIQFALQNRFRRKPPIVRALRVLSGTVGMARLSDFLPCYFVVARA